MLPDSGNCPQIKGIFFFNSEHAQMGHVWSGHVQSVYNMMHVPDSDMCKPINARMHGSSLSSSYDDCY